MQAWDSPDKAALSGAAWSPDGRILITAFAGSRQVYVVYIVGQPPSLKAQLLPLDLPGIDEEACTSGKVLHLL